MLSKWERQTLTKILQGIPVPKTHLKVVRHRIRRKLRRTLLDLQLIQTTLPDLVTENRNQNQKATKNRNQNTTCNTQHNSSSRRMENSELNTVFWARSSAWIEHRPSKPGVGGSSPPGPVNQLFMFLI